MQEEILSALNCRIRVISGLEGPDTVQGFVWR